MKINETIEVAKAFANLLHVDAGQTYDKMPYISHCQSVVDVLLHFNETDKSILAAAYLHDVVEDCGVSLATIEDIFGPKIKELVYAVTDEPGANRKERKEKTYKKILTVKDAVKIKLADRIANLTHSVASGNERMFRMYLKERAEFEKALMEEDAPEVEIYWETLKDIFRDGFRKFKIGSAGNPIG